MAYYEARPQNGRLTGRHKAELQKAGFRWTGLGWIARADKPPRVWGCVVRKVKPVSHKVEIKTEQDWYKFLNEIFGF